MNSRSYQERWNIYKDTRDSEPRPGSQDSGDIIIWDSHLETGIQELDQQHHKLVQLVNMLGRILSSDLESEHVERAVLRIFEELTAYVDYHFRFKEELVERYRCDKEHHGALINAHADFIRGIAEARDAGRDDLVEAAGMALAFLSEWLVKHIFETDMRMAIYILAVKSGVPEEDATKQADSFMKNSVETMRLAMNHLHEGLSSRTHALLEAAQVREREAGMDETGGKTLHKH